MKMKSLVAENTVRSDGIAFTKNCLKLLDGAVVVDVVLEFEDGGPNNSSKLFFVGPRKVPYGLGGKPVKVSDKGQGIVFVDKLSDPYV